MLKHLAYHAAPIDHDRAFLGQVEMIEQRRQLLTEPDLIEPLTKGLNQLLRDALNELDSAWNEAWNAGEALLEKDDDWNALDPDQRHSLRVKRQLLERSKPAFDVQDSTSIIKTLDIIGLEALKDRIAAMPSRYSDMLLEAAKLMEPKAQVVDINKLMLRSTDEVDDWLAETGTKLKKALEKGPVVIR